jgi:hypothetical protein
VKARSFRVVLPKPKPKPKKKKKGAEKPTKAEKLTPRPEPETVER